MKNIGFIDVSALTIEPNPFHLLSFRTRLWRVRNLLFANHRPITDETGLNAECEC